MIIIDGRQSAFQVKNFANLEELLIKVMEDEIVPNNVVTDVFVNEEAFSEIYPHQAEDINAEDIQSVEVRTMSMEEMAGDIVTEMFKVGQIMQSGSKNVATLLRQGDTADGLDLLQDLLEVTRNFLATITLLRERFPADNNAPLEAVAHRLETLLTEMGDVMENQDWLLLADLLEFEFHPACAEWNDILKVIGEDIAALRAE